MYIRTCLNRVTWGCTFFAFLLYYLDQLTILHSLKQYEMMMGTLLEYMLHNLWLFKSFLWLGLLPITVNRSLAFLVRTCLAVMWTKWIYSSRKCQTIVHSSARTILKTSSVASYCQQFIFSVRLHLQQHRRRHVADMTRRCRRVSCFVRGKTCFTVKTCGTDSPVSMQQWFYWCCHSCTVLQQHETAQQNMQSTTTAVNSNSEQSYWRTVH